jgi:SAM-dependent methyltransferase
MSRHASEQSHQSDPRVLNLRTLDQDHPHLASLIAAGMQVLDVGCGTGSITAGIAKAVGEHGRAVGLDRDESLLGIARKQFPGIEFVQGDVLEIPGEFHGAFDIVNAARTLQWVRDPGAAVHGMILAAKPDGGMVVALDYNHDSNAWSPDPPDEFGRFYQAFLDWRTSHGWDNRIATNLPGLFAAAGLGTIVSLDMSERLGQGDDRTNLWLHVIESIGPRIVADGFPVNLPAAASGYRT